MERTNRKAPNIQIVAYINHEILTSEGKKGKKTPCS